MHREVNRLQHRHLVDGPSWRSHTTVLGNPGVQKRRAEVRRASPPRPSLLVGDLAACHDAFSKLQQRVAQLLEASGPAASQADWEPLVVRCRALRESLMSLGRLDAFAMRVFEVSADVCLRARDFSEFLKSARHLLHDIYPTLASQQAMEANAALEAVSSRLANTRLQPPSAEPTTANTYSNASGVTGGSAAGSTASRQDTGPGNSGKALDERSGCSGQPRLVADQGSGGSADQASLPDLPPGLPASMRPSTSGVASQRLHAATGHADGASRSSVCDIAGSSNQGDIASSARCGTVSSKRQKGAATSAGCGTPGNSNQDGAASPSMAAEAHVAGIAACERWAEFAGNFLLYFICVPAKTQGLDVVSVLRGLPHSLQRCSHVQFATSVKCALQAGDFTSFFKLHRRASWSQRTLLDLKLVQMRAWTVSVLASAYRTLSCRSAWRMLALNSGCPQAELLALLKANAESGNAAAANAYSALQMEDPNVQALLVFKS